MIRVVTIDGPAGAGKSTVARLLADRLGWRILDTGAMYRAVTLAAIRGGVDLRSESAWGELVGRIEVSVGPQGVFLDGAAVTDEIRLPEVTRLTRHAADCPAVRRRLVAWQRAYAEVEQDVVSEGRDQGTIVFPDALRKFFLTADDHERARRRQTERAALGDRTPLVETLREVRERDAGDQARTIAPLVAPADATRIDSTGMTLEQVVDVMEDAVRARLSAGS